MSGGAVQGSTIEWLRHSEISLSVRKFGIACPHLGEGFYLFFRDGLGLMHDEPVEPFSARGSCQ